MKFIGKIRKTKLKEKEIDIKIDSYHRSATGALTGTKLYAYPVLTSNEGLHYREIILSQYPIVFWGNIFRLKFWVQDKPGVTKIIFERLKEANINITTQESIMTKYHESYFSISLVADFTNVFEKKNKYYIHDDYKTLKGKRYALSGLVEELFSDCDEINKVTFHEKNPTLKPLELLNHHSGRYDNSESVNHIPEETLSKYRERVSYSNSTNIWNGKISLNKEMIDDLKLNYTENIYYTVNSDTEEKYLIVRFFDETQKIIQLDIEHNSHQSGILYKLSNEIKEIDGYNIINSFDRIQDHNRTSHWVVMIDCSSNPQKVGNLINNLASITNKKVSVINATENFINEVSKLKGFIKENTNNDSHEGIDFNGNLKKQLHKKSLRDDYTFEKTIDYLIKRNRVFFIFLMFLPIAVISSFPVQYFTNQSFFSTNFYFYLVIFTALTPIIFRFIKIDYISSGFMLTFSISYRQKKLEELKKKFGKEFDEKIM